MLKSLFIIATLLLVLVLGSSSVDTIQKSGKDMGAASAAGHLPEHQQHHKHHVVASAAGQLPEHHKHHHIESKDKEHVKHGRVAVPISPHHSKSRRHGRRHKLAKSGKASKSNHQKPPQHPHQQKAIHHKKQAHKGHARNHH